MTLTNDFTARALVLALARTFALNLPAGPARAATITVETEQDLDAFDEACSLREALIAANDDRAYRDCPAGSGADRIVFELSFPATILLTDNLPVITGHLRITGPGMEMLTLDGATAYRPIDLDTTAEDGWLLVEDLALAHGRSPVGGSGGGCR
ncbi:MAG: hypothetical protein K0U98_25040 [Deltaproteobacteria bacterium]|nr:hypothetical protein [Deltaproteobacteria bacterium]